MPVSSEIGGIFYPDAKKDYKTISFPKDPAGILQVSESDHMIMGILRVQNHRKLEKKKAQKGDRLEPP